MSSDHVRRRRSHGVTALIDFALESLPAMRLEDGGFCFERRVGEAAPLGRSARYTLMVELGLLRAQAAGMSCHSTSTTSRRWLGARSSEVSSRRATSG